MARCHQRPVPLLQMSNRPCSDQSACAGPSVQMPRQADLDGEASPPFHAEIFQLLPILAFLHLRDQRASMNA